MVCVIHCSKLTVFYFVVVELDIPYNSEQCAHYGKYFREWTEAEIKKMIKALNITLTMVPFALIVSYND